MRGETTQAWPWKFGIDGLIPVRKAAERCGMSVKSFRRYAALGKFRVGRHPGTGNCKKGMLVADVKSVEKYIESIELDMAS